MKIWGIVHITLMHLLTKFHEDPKHLLGDMPTSISSLLPAVNEYNSVCTKNVKNHSPKLNMLHVLMQKKICHLSCKQPSPPNWVFYLSSSKGRDSMFFPWYKMSQNFTSLLHFAMTQDFYYFPLLPFMKSSELLELCFLVSALPLPTSNF